MIKNWQDDPTLQLVMKKIGDDYDVLSYLGGGGLARVYKVYHKLLKETRVLKIMDFHYILQLFEKSGVTDIGMEFKKIKDRFANEAKAYKKISHPGIIKVYQPGYVEYENNREKIQIPYLILEYVEGASLKAVLKKKPPLKIETVLKISEDVLSTLDTIHQKGIIHRDVKPSNIMIRAETGEAVLIDFGLAKDLDDQESIGITVTRTAMGSAHYMPPEMYMDSKNITKEADIYSFGIILYEMVTANVPFRGNFMEVMHGHLQMPVPEAEVFNKSIFGKEIRKIIVKALAKDAKDRYRSAADFLMALKELKVELVKAGEIDEEYFKDEKKYLKEVTIEDKPRKKFYERPIVWVLGITLLAAFILLFLKIIPEVQFGKLIGTARDYAGKGQYNQAYENLDKAQRIKNNAEVQRLRVAITNQQKEAMGKADISLSQFLKGNAAKQEKLEKCRKFKNMYREVISPEREAEINNIITQLETGLKEDEANRFISNLNTDIKAGEQYQRYMDTVKNLIKSEDYEGAKRELDKARKINNSDEVKRFSTTIAQGLENERKNGEKEYRAIMDKMNLIDYRAFWKNYPNSIYLQNIKERLKAADKNLPPEKYWDKPINKNSKGYYELNFGSELNDHQMIYIPEKRIWIDKYEVSWAQFRKFLQAAKIKFPLIPNGRIINSGDTFPAVIPYEYAQKYCQQYGLRLPSAEEWEYAAGKGNSIYPWGNESPDENGIWRANFDSLEGTVEKDGFEGTAPVKSFEKYSSPFGAVNMTGNVWEWIQGNILKGGGFFSSKEDLKIKNFKRGNNDKEGFRCIKLEK